jgi:xanthine dehydrogenase accessory factor
MTQTIYEEAVSLLEHNRPFTVATVITKDGSTPRAAGAKMIIRNDASIVGTIGGGALEAAIIRSASLVFQGKRSRVEELHLNDKDLSSLNMTCGGDLEVLIDYIDSSDPEYLRMYRLILDLYKLRKPSYLVTLIPSADREYSSRKQFIVLEDGATEGTALCDIGNLKPFISKGVSYKVVRCEENKRAILEAINIPHRAYIFGAGHIGEKLAWVLHFAQFQVTVSDDRPEFANRERFPQADIHPIEAYEKAFDSLAIDRYSLIVIVTRGHVHDGIVLAQALKTNAGYIGMIGSRKKVKALFQTLLNSGYAADDLKRVYTPIGLPIGAESPEEIAVSITAEMIKARSEMR